MYTKEMIHYKNRKLDKYANNIGTNTLFNPVAENDFQYTICFVDNIQV